MISQNEVFIEQSCWWVLLGQLSLLFDSSHYWVTEWLRLQIALRACQKPWKIIATFLFFRSVCYVLFRQNRSFIPLDSFCPMYLNCSNHGIVFHWIFFHICLPLAWKPSGEKKKKIRLIPLFLAPGHMPGIPGALNKKCIEWMNTWMNKGFLQCLLICTLQHLTGFLAKTTRGKQNIPSPHMPPWQKDYFELKTTQNQWTREESLALHFSA